MTSAAAIGGVLVASFVILLGGGAAFRFSPQLVAIGAYLGYDPAPAFRTGTCYLGTNRQAFDRDSCLRLDPARPNYLLVGDSHAAHLWSGLSSAMPEIHLLQASASMCRPLLQEASAFDSRACPRLMHEVFDAFLIDHKVDRILLSASWKDEDIAALANTLDGLKARGLNVTLLGPIVEYDRALPRLLASEIQRGDDSIARRHRSPGIRERDRALRQLAAAKGVDYVSVYDAACPDDRCDTYAGPDIPLQFDTGHLTAEGALVVGRRIALALRGESPVSAAAGTTSFRAAR